MSRLAELIARLCPDGVEYKLLGKLSEIGTGSSNRNESVNNGPYPFFVRSSIVQSIGTYEFDEEAIIIPGEGNIGSIFHYVNGKYALHQRVYRIHFNNESVCAKFAYYYMIANFRRFILQRAVTATVMSIRKPMIETFPLPLPPLPVQQEIVRILDTFTALQAELQAELAARKKQYAHYRDSLLTFNETDRQYRRGKMSRLAELIARLCPDGVEYVPLWKVTIWDKKFNGVSRDKQSKIISYPYMLANELFSLARDAGDVWLLSTGEQTGWTTEELARNFLCDGEVVALPWGGTPNIKYYNGKFITADNRIATSVNKRILNNKYLYYWMSENLDVIGSFYRGSGIKHPSMAAVLDMKIALPPLPVQQEIVRILDRFESLTASLSEGLPAEVAARERQYAHYRDQLLTFKEKTA